MKPNVKRIMDKLREGAELSAAEIAALAEAGAVLRWPFPDGDMGITLTEFLATKSDQLQWLIDHQRDIRAQNEATAKQRQAEAYQAANEAKRAEMQKAIDIVEKVHKEAFRKNREAIERDPNTKMMKAWTLNEKRQKAAEFLQGQGKRGFSLREFQREKIKPS